MLKQTYCLQVFDPVYDFDPSVKRRIVLPSARLLYEETFTSPHELLQAWKDQFETQGYFIIAHVPSDHVVYKGEFNQDTKADDYAFLLKFFMPFDHKDALQQVRTLYPEYSTRVAKEIASAAVQISRSDYPPKPIIHAITDAILNGFYSTTIA